MHICMRMLIDNKDLELLLEKKRDVIGNKVTVDTIIAGISFLLSVFTATYQDLFGIPGIVIKTVFCFIGILYCIKIAKDIVEMYRNKYDHETLMRDIKDLNLIQHNHSLVAIRDTFEKSNRFLVYYDERWDCKLFLNYKTVEQNNEDAIVDRISADLGVDRRKLSCHYVTSRVQEKYSVSHKENRIYNHRLYEVSLSKYPEKTKTDDFVVNGIHYYWMSVEEMEQDDNIMQKNREVVDFVKEKII